MQAAAQAQVVPPAWLMTPPAASLFAAAKERVYRLVTNPTPPPPNSTGTGSAAAATIAAASAAAGSSSSSSSAPLAANKRPEATVGTKATAAPGAVPTVELVLEPNPKWAALQSILTTIRHEIEVEEEENEKAAAAAAENATAAGAAPSSESSGYEGGSRVLILCQDDRTTWELRDVLTLGPKLLLQQSFLRLAQNVRQRDERLQQAYNGSNSGGKGGKGGRGDASGRGGRRHGGRWGSHNSGSSSGNNGGNALGLSRSEVAALGVAAGSVQSSVLGMYGERRDRQNGVHTGIAADESLSFSSASVLPSVSAQPPVLAADGSSLSDSKVGGKRRAGTKSSATASSKSKSTKGKSAKKRKKDQDDSNDNEDMEEEEDDEGINTLRDGVDLTEVALNSTSGSSIGEKSSNGKWQHSNNYDNDDDDDVMLSRLWPQVPTNSMPSSNFPTSASASSASSSSSASCSLYSTASTTATAMPPALTAQVLPQPHVSLMSFEQVCARTFFFRLLSMPLFYPTVVVITGSRSGVHP